MQIAKMSGFFCVFFEKLYLCNAFYDLCLESKNNKKKLLWCMRIVKLIGGLGNQMFQYAFAKSLGEDVLFDCSWYDHMPQKNKQPHLFIQLNLFNTTLKFADENQIKECLQETLFAEKIHKLIYKYTRKHIQIFPTHRVFEKIINRYEPELQEIKGDVLYDGFFQSPKYFNKIRDRLVRDFTPKNPLSAENAKILEDIRNSNSVALSVRRGDYVKLGVALAADYYNRALEEIAKRVENPIFYMFSDDMEWSLKNINVDNKFTIIPCESYDKNCGYICGMYLMSQAKHNIITNSTYPWWSAWLNNNANTITISPKGWLKPTKWNTFEDLSLASWIQI